MKGKMTVYEMIQELAQYPADQLIEVNVYADGFGVEAEAQEEAEEGDYIDAKVCIDEEIQEMSVEEYKKFNGQRVVRINAYTPVPEGERTCEKRMKARTRWGAAFKILYAKILYDYVEVEEVRNSES